MGAFITLTYRDAPENPRLDLQRFIRWLRRRVPGAQYAVVRELTKRGILHFHLVVAPWNYTHQPAISREWDRITGNRVVWIAAVRHGHGAACARYIGKYLMKREKVPNGKALSYSTGWPKLEKTGGIDPEIEYEYTVEDAPAELEREVRAGAVVIITMELVVDHLDGYGCDCYEWKEKPNAVSNSPPSAPDHHQLDLFAVLRS